MGILGIQLVQTSVDNLRKPRRKPSVPCDTCGQKFKYESLCREHLATTHFKKRLMEDYLPMFEILEVRLVIN